MQRLEQVLRQTFQGISLSVQSLQDAIFDGFGESCQLVVGD